MFSYYMVYMSDVIVPLVVLTGNKNKCKCAPGKVQLAI